MGRGRGLKNLPRCCGSIPSSHRGEIKSHDKLTQGTEVGSTEQFSISSGIFLVCGSVWCITLAEPEHAGSKVSAAPQSLQGDVPWDVKVSRDRWKGGREE